MRCESRVGALVVVLVPGGEDESGFSHVGGILSNSATTQHWRRSMCIFCRRSFYVVYQEGLLLIWRSGDSSV